MTGSTEEILKTGYEWSLEANHRLLDVTHYELNEMLTGGYREKDYYLIKVNKFEYMEAVENCEIKENSTPRKSEMFLEYRMYGMVPYNISSIQSGIQFGHAVVEYGEMVKMGDSTIYNKWAKQDKTFIVLNGGTTNENRGCKFYGSMQKNRDLLDENDIFFAEFYEPDLNNSLSAVVFLVDERVFNRELYPDYVNVPYPWNGKRGYKPTDKDMEKWEVSNDRNRKAWVEKIGGPKNDFLRTHLRGFKLAN
jgi:hypothetical protein